MVSTPYRLIPLLLLVPAWLPSQASLDSVVRRLKAGQLLRVDTQDGQRVEGRFSAYTPAPPTLQLAEPPTLIPATRIDSLWVRGNAAKRGAIVGAISVGLPVGLLSAFFCSAVNAALDTPTKCGGAVAGLTAAGAGVGALLGAAIGSASPRWHLRYARASVGLRLTPLPEYRLGAAISFQLGRRAR